MKGLSEGAENGLRLVLWKKETNASSPSNVPGRAKLLRFPVVFALPLAC